VGAGAHILPGARGTKSLFGLQGLVLAHHAHPAQERVLAQHAYHAHPARKLVLEHNVLALVVEQHQKLQQFPRHV
jgi:hypothetical protein